MSTQITMKSAIDIGNDALKGLFKNDQGGAEPVYIPNVVYSAAKTRPYTDLEPKVEDGLHVEIDSKVLKSGKAVCYVGNLAANQSVANELTEDRLKRDNDQTIILLLTSIAMRAAVATDDNRIDARVLLSTGLPLSETRVKGARKEFKERLMSAPHTVEFLDTPEIGEKIVTITFEDVLVSPEGQAAYIVLSGMEDVNEKEVMIVDVGGLSTDIAVVKPGGVIDNTSSTGIKLGMASYQDAIIRSIEEKHGVRPLKNRRELHNILTSADPYRVKVKGKTLDIEDIVSEHFTRAATVLYQEINRVWNSRPSVEEAEMIGGGSVALQPFLKEINRRDQQFPLRFINADSSVWTIATSYMDLLDIYTESKIGDA